MPETAHVDGRGKVHTRQDVKPAINHQCCMHLVAGAERKGWHAVKHRSLQAAPNSAATGSLTVYSLDKVVTSKPFFV
jgi:hypothetical protein